MRWEGVYPVELPTFHRRGPLDPTSLLARRRPWGLGQDTLSHNNNKTYTSVPRMYGKSG